MFRRSTGTRPEKKEDLCFVLLIERREISFIPVKVRYQPAVQVFCPGFADITNRE